MSDVAIYRPPRARTMNGRRIISAVVRAEMENIERLLSGDEHGPVGDEALAERDRLWSASRNGVGQQPDLPLVNPGGHACPSVAPSPRGGIEEPRDRFSFAERLNLNVEPERRPVDGSSPGLPDAGNQTRNGRVHSGSGTY